MPEKFIIVLDQGSSSSRALAFDPEGNIRYKAQRKIEAAIPPGRAEYDAEKLYLPGRQPRRSPREDPEATRFSALGIAAQRSTVVFWDKEPAPPAPP